ncbi:MAG TPA: hypothetical protein DC054_18910 [Blastocatellia bacterium]|nr:hypothetical protein [Blastocatellia bacterium]
MNPGNSKTVFERSATWVVLSFVVSLFLFHLYVIHKYAVEIPIIDDWAMFRPDRPAKLSVAWLLDTSNTRTTASEHVIATTKLFVWIQYHLDQWNIHVNLILNFLILGFLVWWIVWFANKAVPEIPLYAKLAFAIFLLSPIDWFNHFMATQTCYLFYLIFFFLGSYVLFRDTQRWRHIVAGSLLAVLSICSLASGFGSCLVLLSAFCVFKGARIYSKNNSGRRINEATQLAVTVFLIGGGLTLWLAHYVTPAHVELVFPNDRRFWQFFLNLVSFGFGIETYSSWWGTLCLLVVLVPICAIIWKRKGRLTGIEWACFVMVAGILVNVGQIALGRAYPGVETGSKVLRYVEFVLPLIPLSMIAWAILLRGRKRAVMLGSLFAFCLLTFANDWSFDIYRYEALRRIEGRECVKAYYKGIGDGRCPTLYIDRQVNIPLATWLDNAKAVNVLFYQNLREEIETENQQPPVR